MTPETFEVERLARRLRQSLQTCTSHTIGPVASFAKCIEAHRAGLLSETDFRRIGQMVIERSLEEITRHQASRLGGPESDNLLYRERCVIDFTRALFGLGSLSKVPLPSPDKAYQDPIGNGERQCL
jgi:hypothetical protein